MKTLSAFVALVVFAAAPSRAAEERLVDLGRLFKDDSHPVVQEVWVLGRYHGQYHWTDGDGGRDEDWEHRRARLGLQARFAQNLTFHMQALSGTDLDPDFNGFSEFWLGWKFNDAVTLTVGQQKHRFTHDRNISSRYINYLERSMLTNMFGLDYTPAVTLQGRVGPWVYYTGAFSGSTDRKLDKAWELDAGRAYVAHVTREFTPIWGTDTTYATFSALRSDVNDKATNLTRFEDGIASSLVLTKGATSVVTEITGGLSGPEGDAWGLNLQAGHFATDRAQVVWRYQLAVGSEDNTLVGQSRYDRPAGMLRGKRYRAGYLGLNYHIAQHRLKVMGGVEYARMDDQGYWTTSVALRLFWGPHSRGPFPMAQVLDAD